MRLLQPGFSFWLSIFYGLLWSHRTVIHQCYKSCEFLLPFSWTLQLIIWSGEEARIRLSSDIHSPICDQDELRIHTSTSDIPTVEKDKQLLNPRSSPVSPTSGSDDTARPSTSNSPILKPPSSSSKFSISSERQTLLTVPKTSATRTSSEPSSNYSYSQKAYALYDCTYHTSAGKNMLSSCRLSQWLCSRWTELCERRYPRSFKDRG